MDTILASMQLDESTGGIASASAPRASLLVADVARSGVTGVVLILGTERQSDQVFSGVKPLRAGRELSGNYEVAARLLGEHSDGRASFVLIGTSRTFPQREPQQVSLYSLSVT